jgi:hypothetical protein
MKKTLTIITLLAGAVSGYSQGNITFSLYSGTFRQAVYNTQAAIGNLSVSYAGSTVTEMVGSSPAAVTTAETPVGTTAYTAGSGLSGTGYSVELLVGPAGISTASGTVQESGSPVGLLPFGGLGNVGGVPVTFYTGPARKIGFASSAVNFTTPATSYFAAGDTVSVAIAAWNNEGGTVLSLATAVADKVPWGISPVEQTTTGLTTGTGSPIALPTSLESFSLGVATPEPSTIALGVMGASALLFRRRK